MATEKFICAICGEHLHIDPNKLEEFVPGRLWGLKLSEKIHSCGHESVFARGEPIYSAFLYKPGDAAMELLSKVELSKWRDKAYFHYIEEGVQDKEEFKQVMCRLIDEVDSILKNPKIRDKEDRVRLIAQDKLEGYKEKIERGKFERKREKFVPNGEA